MTITAMTAVKMASKSASSSPNNPFAVPTLSFRRILTESTHAPRKAEVFALISSYVNLLVNSDFVRFASSSTMSLDWTTSASATRISPDDKDSNITNIRGS